MGKQIDLQLKLENLIGSTNVYFQPPETVRMEYPAIVYSRDKINTKYANDKAYDFKISYEVIVIDRDPDSIIIGEVAKLPFCSFNRNYTIDNLNHDAFTLYF